MARLTPRLAALALVLAAQVGAGVREAAAQEPEAALPGQREVLAATRALAYDRKLAPKGGETLVLGVVYREEDPLSVACADQVFEVLDELSGTTLRDHPLRATRLPFSGAEDLDERAGAEHIAVAYVCTGLDADIKAVTRVARNRQVVTATFSREYVEQGIALGVISEDGKHRILVNLPASRAQGSALRASLLDIAEVIR